MKKLLIILGIIICPIFIICLPLIIDKLFYLTPPFDFLYVHYDSSDILVYYSSIFSFLGTIILGILTLRQNKIAQDKSDEVNRLQLELQKKSMAMAEEEYKRNPQPKPSFPKFEVALNGYNGYYQNASFTIKNVCSSIVSSLTVISVSAYDSNETLIGESSKQKLSNKSLSSGEIAKLETTLPELVNRQGSRYQPEISHFSNAKVLIKFLCEDEFSVTHYYTAILKIPNTKEFSRESFSVEKVG